MKAAEPAVKVLVLHENMLVRVYERAALVFADPVHTNAEVDVLGVHCKVMLLV